MEIDNIQLLKETIEAAADIKTVRLECGRDVQLALVPDNYRLEDLDQYEDRPRRMAANPVFATVDGFAAYLHEWKGENTLLRGHLNDGSIKAIIDYHAHQSGDKPLPSRCDHVAILKSDVPPEWEAWEKHEKQRFTQRNFLHFIEDNAEDILTPDLTDLIGTIKDVKIGGSGRRTSSVSTTHEDQSAVKRTEVESGLPDIITLSLRPWRHCVKYEVKARPFIHIEDGEPIMFSYHLINIARVREAAFNDVAQKVNALVDLPVLI